MGKQLKILITALVLLAAVQAATVIWERMDHAAPTPRSARAEIDPKNRAFIEISPESRARLLEKVKAVEIGDTIEKVLEKLGQPAAKQDSSTTQPTQAIPMRVGDTILTYYIRKREKDVF